MAALFLVLAVIVGVAIGDTVVANSAAGSIQLFSQTITGFTQGQLMLIAAGAGFILALLLVLSFGSGKSRRARRREQRLARREMQGRIGELEQENTSLRTEVDRDHRTTRLGEMGAPVTDDTGETTQTSRRIFPSRRHDSIDDRTGHSTVEADRRDVFNQADR
jgi:ABC-type multidrug transport system fused ATPase/permease subunit